jgi:hypothetical protein
MSVQIERSHDCTSSLVSMESPFCSGATLAIFAALAQKENIFDVILDD